MSRPSAIDAPVALAELLEPRDLIDVAASFADQHGAPVAVVTADGRVLACCGAAAPAADWARAPLRHHGDELGAIVVGPGGPGHVGVRAAAHIAQVVAVLVHAAHARHLTAAVHLAAMDEAYQELTDKNRRLAEAVERLQEVDRLKSNFLATVSHELRTPLTSIIGYSEMLLEGLAGGLGKDQREYVQTVLAKADQLLQLITGILDVSLSESGALRVAREPVALDDLVRNVALSFAGQARRRRIDVAAVVEAIPRALGDPRKIRQVVANLLANAIKFTPDGGAISVALEVGPLVRDEQTDALAAAARSGPMGLRVHVRDSGIGIPGEKQSRIFEPFFQVDSSSTREYGGTGLGLTLVKSYVEAHGGHVWVDSAVGHGSVFTFTLPAVPDDLHEYMLRNLGA